MGEDSSCSSLSASLSCGPSVIRLSQSLVHTTSMAVNLWREKEEGEREGRGQTASSADADLLMGHYILCNDTLDDIHFGQVATGEDLLLPSNSCIGYSWRNHKANLQVIITKLSQIIISVYTNFYTVTYFVMAAACVCCV